MTKERPKPLGILEGFKPRIKPAPVPPRPQPSQTTSKQDGILGTYLD
ncbi:MAG: hypothetical protein ACYCW6_24910 [Candidatus Xenobia bacterium]